MKKVNKFVRESLVYLIVGGVSLLCILFLIFGHLSESGQYITLDGADAQIPEATITFRNEAEEAMYRLMNEDKPTDELVEAVYNEPAGQGFATSIEAILTRREPDGNTDNGLGWQCSKYTAYLATGKREYSTTHTDYGPVNGKDVAAWLVRNYGFKYIKDPVEGAIGSGGFNTLYGHTAMFLYWASPSEAVVNDANFTPLAVSTHSMNVDGWVWVVPGDYTPKVEPTSTEQTADSEARSVSSCDEWHVKAGDTMSKIMLICENKAFWGRFMDEYAMTWVSTVIKPGQSVYDGWRSETGVGLYAGDIIKKIKE